MPKISKEVGAVIRNYRQARNLSIQALADKINKSKSTMAKYETGEISIDIDTLYEISCAMEVPVESFLIPQELPQRKPQDHFEMPVFFQDRSLYAYFWDSRNNKLNISVLKIGNPTGAADNIYHASFYMNILDVDHPYICENAYVGTIEFHHVLINITLTHRDTPIEHAMIHILENFNSAPTKWGMYCGVSFRPFMPVAFKILFSRSPLKVTKELCRELKVNKEDIRKMKMYNFYSVTQDW